MEERNCLKCGKTFLTNASPARLATGRGKYCSRSCGVSANHTGLAKPKSAANALIARQFTIGKSAHNALPPVIITCGQCKQEFGVQPNRVGKAKFCSRECSNAWKRSITGTDHPLFVEKPKMACEWCGTIREVKPSLVSRFRFCSRRCSGAYVASTWPRTSSIEKALHDELNARSIAFEMEYQIGPFVIDIAIPDAMVAVEADGTYWHGLEKQKKKDRAKDAYLVKSGWTIIRLPESDIRADASACVDRIATSLPCQE